MRNASGSARCHPSSDDIICVLSTFPNKFSLACGHSVPMHTAMVIVQARRAGLHFDDELISLIDRTPERAVKVVIVIDIGVIFTRPHLASMAGYFGGKICQFDHKMSRNNWFARALRTASSIDIRHSAEVCCCRICTASRDKAKTTVINRRWG